MDLGVAPLTVGWPSHMVSNQQNVPGATNLLTGQSQGGDGSTGELPFFQASLVCVAGTVIHCYQHHQLSALKAEPG